MSRYLDRHDLARVVLRLTIAFALILATGYVCRASSINADGSPRVVGTWDAVLRGEADFCARFPETCQPALNIRLELTAAQLGAVARLNRDVNLAITPMFDQAHWGVPDRWDFAEDGIGDCEDFALVKRARLAGLGLPPGALLLTVVRDHTGDLHMVLTLQTTWGDFILDNLTDRILPWHLTDLVFVARQDPETPGRWVALEGRGARAKP